MVEIFENIRQLYTFSAPCGELSPYIEFYSESEPEKTLCHAGSSVFSVKMFPSFTPTFYINLGSPYLIASGGNIHQIGAEHDILILRDSMVERHNQASDNIFTVKFHPGGLEAVLGINQNFCLDKVVSLVEILPQALLKSIKTPISFSERTELMEVYLLSKLKQKTNSDHYLNLVNKAIGEYENNQLSLSTDCVAEKVFLSSKTINRYFHRVIGLSPKSYFRMLRTRTALTAYIHGEQPFLPEKFGYYDSSHFSKDVFQFTGQKLRDKI